jgi:alkanesulfonate monooxygenase
MASWRHPDAPVGGEMDLQHFVNTLRVAERGKLDIFFLPDGSGVRGRDEPRGALSRSSRNIQFEPITLLCALAMASSHIGLMATASTSYNEPFNIARKFASLDHISGGRAGWNVVTSRTEMEAQNFGLDKELPAEQRYARAAEFVEVVCGLWDSWEQDAFIRDKQSGIFYDPDRMHMLEHKGTHFSVRGPLNIAGTPQGRPILAQAGASPAGQELAAATAEVIYAAASTFDEAKTYYDSVKGRMAKYGRPMDHLKIMPGVMAFPGRTRQEAQDKYDLLQDLLDPILGLAKIAESVGDLSGYALDELVPDVSDFRNFNRGKLIIDQARRRNMTLRQLCVSVSASYGHGQIIGTPGDIVDQMEDWYLREAADGFNILPPHLPGGLADVVDMVVPEMQRRGLFKIDYAGRTLRENLGLPPHVNRYAAQRAAHRAAGE